MPGFAAPHRQYPAITLAALLTLVCGPAAAPAAVAAEATATVRPSLTVTATAVRSGSWPVALSASGPVAAWMEASIGARITGLPLVDVLVNVGDRVHKGQLLARFDDATVRTELDQLEAALAQAEAAEQQALANSAQAAANRDRALSIRDSGAISEQDLLQYTTLASTAQSQVALSRAQIAQARANLAANRLRMEYTRVVAPDDGIISARGATIGSVSQAAGGGAELFRLIRQGRLEWRPELTASQLTLVRAGQQVTLTLPDGSTVQGRVRQTGPSLDGSTRLGMAYVDLAAGNHALPAMYLSGTLQLAQRTGLLVPAESVVIRDGRSYVLRLEGQRCRLVAVTVGRRQEGQVELLSGAREGETVVVKGAGFLNDNDLVRVVAAAPAPAAPAAAAAHAETRR
jgi:RND family efflux transporter MFP subunit